jgi:CHAT domain-containing protein
LQKSLEVAQTLPSPQAVSDAQLSLGNTARAQADTKASLEFYQKATAASISPTKKIQAQLNQLSLLLETQQFSAAQSLWPQIQSQIPNLPPSRRTVYARINFAQSLMRLRKDTTADSPSWLDIAQLLSTGVQQATSLKDQRTESYALGTLGGLYEQTKQVSSAQDLTEKALLIAQMIDASDIAYQWQWQLGRLLKTKGDIKGALTAYDEAYKTLNSLRSDLAAINPDVQFTFRESVEPVYRQFVDLLLTTEGNSEPTPENLKQARNVIESLQLAELDNFFREACLVAKVGLDEVIDKEAPTTAVIYPIILPNRLEVILKLANQNLRRYTTAVPQTEVENIIEQLGEDIKEHKIGGDNQSRFQKMYELLLRQAETDLRNSNVETLVFVLDGSLRNIPMSALYDGKQYLVEKYSVAVSPGLQLFDLKPLAPGQLEALTGGLSEARHNFPKLDYVESELKQIQSQVSSKMLLNPEFTSKAFQTQINSHSFPVVHLATHGQFSSNPDKTFILAYDQPIKVNELNKLLRSRDEKRPDAIELLVLSACQTAAGDKRAALGLAGVAVRAGARSTLASLWNLNDASTALLMSHFYQELAKPGVSKAEALRRAQLALLKQEEYEIPYFWAPYVLIGNWL